jgi:hypothetical protein
VNERFASLAIISPKTMGVALIIEVGTESIDDDLFGNAVIIFVTSVAVTCSNLSSCGPKCGESKTSNGRPDASSLMRSFSLSILLTKKLANLLH